MDSTRRRPGEVNLCRLDHRCLDFGFFLCHRRFAAAGRKGQSQSSGISRGQLRELGTAQRWCNNFRTRPGRIANSSDRVKLDHYLSQYAFALAQAGAIVRNGGLNSNGQGNNNSGQANNSSGQSNGSNGQSFTQNNQPVQQQLATYLSMMRGLRDKIESVAGSANSNNNGNNAGNGISVTGGSSTTTGSQGTTTNSSTGSNSTGAAAATATPTTSSSSSESTTSAATATPAANGSNSNGSTASSSGATTNSTGSNSTASSSTNNTQANGNQVSNSSLQKMWGTQFRDLQAALRWYNTFRTEPGRFGNNNRQNKTQQCLDQYAFALRQAFAILRNGTNAKDQGNNTSGQANNSGSQTNNSSGQGTGSIGSFIESMTPQQQLAMYLHMMRGLQDKIMGGSNNTNTTTP